MSGAVSRLGLIGPVPPPNGGMALQTRQLAELLGSEGLQVELLPTNAPYYPAWIERLPVIRAVFRLLPYLFRCWTLAGRVDVIHLMANSGWSWQLFCAPAIWSGALRGTPVVVNYRGGEARSYFQRSFSWVAPSLRRAASIVVPSEYLQRVFADFGVAVDVIPNIVNLERFRPAAEAPASGSFTIVIARNLEPIYGLDTALHALAILVADIPDVLLRIAGSGPQGPQLEALALELGVADNVSFEGRLEPEAMAALYRSAQLSINPALVDNMPNSVLEALASGVPVISTNVGGVPYIVEHESTALLVAAGDAEAMAQSVLRLYENIQLRQQLARNGLQQAQQYAWPLVREQWLTHYLSVQGRAIS